MFKSCFQVHLRIARFKEREENVKADIFTAYIALLRQTRSTTLATTDEDMDVGEGPLSLLASQVPCIVGSVSMLEPRQR